MMDDLFPVDPKARALALAAVMRRRAPQENLPDAIMPGEASPTADLAGFARGIAQDQAGGMLGPTGSPWGNVARAALAGVRGVLPGSPGYAVERQRIDADEGTSVVPEVRREQTLDANQAYFESLPMMMQAAYHGTPHAWEGPGAPLEAAKGKTFDLSKMGTGEGAQAYGWGAYATKEPHIAETYRRELSGRRGAEVSGLATEENAALPSWVRDRVAAGGKGAVADMRAEFERRMAEDIAAKANSPQPWLLDDRIANHQKILGMLSKAEEAGGVARYPEGRLYKLDAPEDYELLHFDKRVAEQSPQVQEALAKISGPRAVLIAGTPIANFETAFDPATRLLAREIGMNGVEKARAFLSEPIRGPLGAERRAALEKLNDWEAKGAVTEAPTTWSPDISGRSVAEEMAKRHGAKGASEALRAAGIPGHLFTGNASGVENFVIYDPARAPVVDAYQSLAEMQARAEAMRKAKP